MAHDVFISHSSRDKPVADAVCATLEARGVRCWIAPRDIAAGADWAAAIIDAINASRIFVLILSSHANASPQVAREIERAAHRGITILPVRVDATELSKSIEFFISNQHWLDALTPPLERHLAQLADNVQTLLGQTPAPRATPPTPSATQPAADPLAHPEALLGQQIGHYRLGGVLGQGGSGVAFAAVHVSLGRRVCVKVLHPLTTDSGAAEAAIALAARALATVRHPSLIEIFDFGRAEVAGRTLTYLAMELVEGQPLNLWSAASPTLAEKLRLAATLARALDAAHRCTYLDDLGMQRVGLLHGDSKPTNVIVRPNGVPVLLDFLLIDVQRRLDPARPAAAPDGTDFTTAAFGTPGYMPPEQAQSGILTPKTDLYGLAATIAYTLFPFHPDAKAALASGLLPELPADVRATLLAMLADDPERRPGDLTALALQFEQAAGALAATPPAASFGATPSSVPITVVGPAAVGPRSDWTPGAFTIDAAPAAIAPTGAPAQTPPPWPVPPTLVPIPPSRPVPPTSVPLTPGARPQFSAPPPLPLPPPPPPVGGASLGPGQAMGQAGPPTVDAVQFTVTAPPAVVPGAAFVLGVWAHLAPQFDQVVERARATFAGHAPVGTKGPLSIERGVTLTIHLRIDGFAIDDPEDTLLWTGDIGNATFGVRVPPETPPGARVGQATIYVAGLRLGRVAFSIDVAPSVATLAAGPLPASTERHRRAFVSYARPDSRDVLARIQGIQKAAPDLDLFLDTLTLRSGQYWERELWQVIPQSDVFYLFWSPNARQSEWVEREWRCALETRGLDFIDPVPLAPPQEAPPPPELSGKHFDDWALAFARGQRATPRPPSLTDRLRGWFRR